MNKLLFTFLLLFCLLKESKGQWVTIPDTNFVNWLTLNYPACMNGNQMDTTCNEIVNETSVDCSHQFIHDLNGIQYFDNLDSLNCSNNYSVTTPPHFPNSLTYLDCNMDGITSFTSLPNSLTFLNCEYNLLFTLPSLPNTLKLLNCFHNNLTSLPALPNSLLDLDCSFNQLSTLPTLSNNIESLSFCVNNVWTLPDLPNSITVLLCNNNHLLSFPDLPDSLTNFQCADNLYLMCLPQLKKIVNFIFDNTGITCLPNYPINNTSSFPTLSSVPLCATFNPNSCPDYSGVTNQDNNLQISIYPNPVTSQLTITNLPANSVVQLLDITGRVLFNQTSTTSKLIIDMSAFPSGIYLLKTNEGVKKVVLYAE